MFIFKKIQFIHSQGSCGNQTEFSFSFSAEGCNVIATITVSLDWKKDREPMHFPGSTKLISY